jgi:hypothetical protein
VLVTANSDFCTGNRHSIRANSDVSNIIIDSQQLVTLLMSRISLLRKHKKTEQEAIVAEYLLAACRYIVGKEVLLRFAY